MVALPVPKPTSTSNILDTKPLAATTTNTMYTLIVLVMVQLCAMCTSALAIPSVTAATPRMWDIQRATIFKTPLDTSLKDTHHAAGTESTLPEIIVTPTPSTKIIKSRTPMRLAKAHTPTPGIQCTVM
jgi:hypothetical protein